MYLVFKVSLNDNVGTLNGWIERYRDDWKVTNMIYRDLGRVKLLETNFDATSTGEGFKCFRRYYDNSGKFIDEGVYYGNVKLANTPQIAVYPDIN